MTSNNQSISKVNLSEDIKKISEFGEYSEKPLLGLNSSDYKAEKSSSFNVQENPLMDAHYAGLSNVV